MYVLFKLMELLTGPRSRILPGRDFEWSGESWTHNAFRWLETVFGRKCGVRIEMTSCLKDGVEYQYAHTFEASIALFETWVRNLAPRWVPVRVWIPVLQTPNGIPVPASPYLFAIAFDAASNGPYTGGGPSSITWSHTTTGSNTFMAMGGLHQLANTNVAAFTYNSVGGTMAQFNDGSLGAFATLVLFYLVAPTTGSNSVLFDVTVSAGEGLEGWASTFTGAKQTGQPDSSNKGYTSSGISTLAVSTTVVASNCWLVGVFDCGGADNTMTAGSGTTLRYANTNDNSFWGDSNGTVGTGSQSLTANRASGTSGMQGSVLSIAPVPASGPTNWKTWNTVTVSSNLKTLNTNAIANIKTYDTIT